MFDRPAAGLFSYSLFEIMTCFTIQQCSYYGLEGRSRWVLRNSPPPQHLRRPKGGVLHRDFVDRCKALGTWCKCMAKPVQNGHCWDHERRPRGSGVLEPSTNPFVARIRVFAKPHLASLMCYAGLPASNSSWQQEQKLSGLSPSLMSTTRQ